MSLDKSLGLLFLLIAAIYAYTAFFVMDAALLPFAKMSPIWPSSFPKILSILAIGIGLLLIFSSNSNKENEDVFKQFEKQNWQRAALLISMMIAYALLLRPIGFVLATISFLTIGPMILGEKNKIKLIIIATIFAVAIWYLVQQVLGIYLRPLPGLFYGE